MAIERARGGSDPFLDLDRRETRRFILIDERVYFTRRLAELSLLEHVAFTQQLGLMFEMQREISMRLDPGYEPPIIVDSVMRSICTTILHAPEQRLIDALSLRECERLIVWFLQLVQEERNEETDEEKSHREIDWGKEIPRLQAFYKGDAERWWHMPLDLLIAYYRMLGPLEADGCMTEASVHAYGHANQKGRQQLTSHWQRISAGGHSAGSGRQVDTGIDELHGSKQVIAWFRAHGMSVGG